MANLYKNRTIDDALVYLDQVFGLKSISEIPNHPEIAKRIKENAKDGYILDSLLQQYVRVNELLSTEEGRRKLALEMVEPLKCAFAKYTAHHIFEKERSNDPSRKRCRNTCKRTNPTGTSRSRRQG